VIVLFAGSSGGDFRLRHPHRRRARAARHVDPAPDSVTLAIRHRFEAAGVFSNRRGPGADGRASNRSSSVARLRAPSCSSRASRRSSRAVCRRQLLIVSDATEPEHRQHRASVRGRVRSQYSRELGARARPASRIVPTVRMRFNPTRQSSNLFVPGLMAFVLTIISSLMTGDLADA